MKNEGIKEGGYVF